MFIAFRWTYGAFLQPFNSTTVARLDAVYAGYISAVLIACTVPGTGRRCSSLPPIRALLRIHSPPLRRQVLVHRYVAKLHRGASDPALPRQSRLGAQVAHATITTIPGILDLAPDMLKPWGLHQEQKARAAKSGVPHNIHVPRSLPQPSVTTATRQQHAYGNTGHERRQQDTTAALFLSYPAQRRARDHGAKVVAPFRTTTSRRLQQNQRSPPCRYWPCSSRPPAPHNSSQTSPWRYAPCIREINGRADLNTVDHGTTRGVA